ncbi:sensor histidine kinase [Paenibacillus sp. 1P07SE]|uniref:sensor histidine kinase n=1 Tax=Paenibacillus sp. 1P07SE TaxID=3132209 RepID=UPI0039A5CB2A
MKWKLTGRYLFSILSIVLIVIIVNTLMVIGILLYQHRTGLEEVSSDSAERFTREFSQYMRLENDEPVVTEAGLQALSAYGAWLQILDGSGHVVSAYDAPDTASTHYSPVELVHKYKYMDDEFNTYFLGGYETYSYIVGIPYSQESRFVFTLNFGSFLSQASRALLVMIIVDVLIAAAIGLLFSSVLSKPVHAIIERIAQLKQRNFAPSRPKRPGVYTPVFDNLNDVSRTLQQHEEERLKLERMRSEWISNVSHDLKTPLASIQGYAELLGEEGIDGAERLEYAGVIERQSIYMKELIEDLNLTMRLRSHDLPMQLQDTRIEPFVRELVIDVLNDPQFKDRDLTFDSEAPELRLPVDQHLMKRALLNFVHNALIHSGEASSVTVKVSDTCVTIADNGHGIPEEEQTQVFDRYYRGTHTLDTRGTGLGMAIARDIIEAHGMAVELTSQEGKGTVVKVRWNGAAGEGSTALLPQPGHQV